MFEDLAFDEIKCNQCVAEGEYLDDFEKIPFGMLGLERKNHIKLKRQKINYSINIKLLCNRKSISISSDKQTSLDAFYAILMEIMRFENLYEGCFFPLVSLKIDGEEFIKKIENYNLEYYKSTRKYAWIPINLTDREYKTLFLKFKSIIEKNYFIHQVYLYSTYLNGMTADLRMAIFLQVFEPIANELAERGEIQLKAKPYKIFSNNCPSCGQKVTRKVSNKEIFFADRLYAIILKYGKEVFEGDSKSKIVQKSVNLRNRMDHVCETSKNCLTGEQCGFYIIKFDLLYRIILFREIGVIVDNLKEDIVKHIENYNKQFPQHRINV